MVTTAGDPAGRAFVYGTLMPGHLRWPLLEPYVVDHVPGTVAGRLYDTGWGYPAARFDEAGEISGVVCVLDPARVDEVWALLDEVEGAQYQRRVVEVAVVDGPTVRAGSYEFRAGHQGLADLHGRWEGV